MFRYKEDKWPVVIILAFSMLDFAAFFLLQNIWLLVLYPLVFFIVKINISAWNHHHQHTPTFRHEALNRVLEFFYALHTGVTTNMWCLHHNIGHHVNFLDQNKDESGWKRKDGSTMGHLEYSFNVFSTAHYRAFKVGERFPKIQKKYLIFTSLTFLIVGLLTWYNPMQGLFIFVIPMILSLFFTCWVTYGHHAGLDTSNEFEGSYNNEGKWFNVFTGNLGYHTAHNHKPGVHWSKLPALHETIKDKIPEKCYVNILFEGVPEINLI